MRGFQWVVAISIGVAAIWATEAVAANGDCSQPESSGSGPTATDCLRILNVAVGLGSCDPHAACVCAPKGSLPATATDALVCLTSAVGGSATLDCPCGLSTSTTTTFSGDCNNNSQCYDGEPCNGFEICNGGTCESAAPLACDENDLVIVVPYQQAAQPVRDIVEATTTISRVDAYIMLDRAPSMSDEVSDLRNNINTAVRAATCFPVGTGFPPDCIQDLYTGIGWIGYSGGFGEAYRHRLDLQQNPSALSGDFPTSEPSGGCCARTTKLAMWAAATGKGNINAGCTVGSSFPANGPCDSSAAGQDGIGYPCFRDDALRSIVLLTDVRPSSGHGCTTIVKTTDDAFDAGVRIMSLYGGGADAATISELETFANNTAATDVNNANAPLVFDGSTGNVAASLTTAVLALASGARLTELTASATDDPSDAVDATQFIDAFETAALGTAECTDGLFEQDTDFDGHADAYLGVIAGTPVCWSILPAVNTTVTSTGSAQLFRATITVDDSGFAGLDQTEVVFIVPPN